jgi:hypothetical protein
VIGVTYDESTDLEVQRLQAENEELRARNEELGGGASERGGRSEGARRGGWRWGLAALLLLIGALALAVGVSAVWTRNLLLNTDRYTQTVAPLAQNPDIRSSVSVAAVDELFSKAGVETRIKDALPPRASFLAPELTDRLHGRAVGLSEKALATPQFQKLWVEGNRKLHSALVPLLLGKSGPKGVLNTSSGTISLDLTQIVRSLKSTLAARGITVVEQVPDNALGGKMVLVQSSGLAQAQRYVKLLQQLAIGLPIAALLALVLAVVAAPNRRKGILWAGVAIVVAMIAIGTGLGLARTYYLGSVNRAVLSQPAAAAFFDTMVRFLRDGIRLIAVVGLLVVIGAALAGPSRPALAFRSAGMRGMGGLLGLLGVDVPPVSEWFRRRRPLLDFAWLLLFGAVLLAANSVTVGLVIGMLVVALFGVLVVEMIARAGGRSQYMERGQPA